MRPGTIKKLISGALLALVLGSAWFYFAPAGVGGSTSWVVTDGVSMEPRFHSGDLVLVRAQSDYRVGEIVAYHSKSLHTVVLHRIVGRAGARYIFKGDNNNFVDFEHPARSQLIGALWLHLAGVGGTLDSLRSPLLIGGLFALATLLFAGAAFTRHRRLRRRARRAGATTPSPGPSMRRPPAQALQLTILAGCLLALLPFASLALLAFTRPSEALLRTQAPYEQHGTLSYTAAARPGPVYPGNRAQTGDPLFTHVVDLVALRFDYRFHGAAAHRLDGSISMSATLRSVLGWQRTIPLGPATAFHGDRASITRTLDLRSLLGLIQRVEASTGLKSTYTLTLTPRVTARGELDGLPLGAGFAPAIAFSLNELELQPLIPGGGASGRAPSTSAFSRSSNATASGRRSQAMQISLGLFDLKVSTGREIALAGIALSVCAASLLLALARPRRRDESATIRARYGGLIIPVERVWQQPGVAVIDVADIEALVRIAGHYERSILHELTDYGEAFWVTDESGQFRYWIEAPQDQPAALAWSSVGLADPDAPTMTLETARFEGPGQDAPTLEFTAVPGQGAAQTWGSRWEFAGPAESVEHVETPPGVEPGSPPAS